MDNDSYRKTCCKRRTILEFCLMIILALLVIGALLWYLLQPIRSKECETPECIKAASKLHEFINPDADPCENFYNFACGRFLNRYSIEKSVSSILDEQEKKVKKELKKITTEPITDTDPHSLMLLKELFHSCMNLTAINENKDEDIKHLIENLGGWPVVKRNRWLSNSFTWHEVTVKARSLGLKYQWFIDVAIADTLSEGKTLPKVTFPNFLRPVSKNLKNFYKHLMAETASHFGAPGNMSFIEIEIDAVIEFEEKLIKIIEDLKKSKQSSVVEPIVEMQNRWPMFNWLKFIQNITMTKKTITDDFLIVNDIENYMGDLEELLRITPKRIQANYFIWKVLWWLSPLFSQTLRNRFEVFRLIQDKTHADRMDVCMDLANEDLKHVVESEYVRRHVDSDMQKQTENLMKSLQNVLLDRISKSTWMDPETRYRAANKTFDVTGFFGGTPEMFDSEMYDRQLGLSQFQFSFDRVVGKRTQLKLNKYKLQFNKLYEDLEAPFDFVFPDWSSVNGRFHFFSNRLSKIVKAGLYHAQVASHWLQSIDLNSNLTSDQRRLATNIDGPLSVLFIIMKASNPVITAPIMQDDFYDKDRPNYLNYGMMGYIMGHELAHGFHFTDTAYVTSNSTLVENWITTQSLDKLENRMKCIASEHSRYSSPYFTDEFNDTDNLGENYSDFVGIDAAYVAYKHYVEEHGREDNLPGVDYTPNQLFWIQASSLMCNAKETDLDYIYGGLGENKHSLPVFRVVGPLRSSKYFAEDFGCPINSEMNPRHKCQVL